MPDSFAHRLSGKSWEPAPHLKIVCYFLWLAAEGIVDRLQVAMPPGHAKTSTVSQWFPLWLLDRDPTLRVILAQYAAEIAEENGKEVRNLWGEHRSELSFDLRQDSQAANRWRTLEGGGMWSAGAGGSITGRRANVFIVDDPYKDFDHAHSPREREKVENWYEGTVRTRLLPRSSIVIVHTRWHESDMIGKREKDPRWVLLRFPAVAEEDETIETVLGGAENAQRLRDRGVPLPEWNRAEGEALWPIIHDEEGSEVPWYDLTELDDAKSELSAYKWSGLYQQRPAPPEGGIVKRKWWKFCGKDQRPERFDQVAISIDTTFKDTDSADYCVMQLWGKRRANFYLLSQIRDQMDYVTFKQSLRGFHARHPEATKIFIEDSANGPAVISDLKNEIPGLIPVQAKGSKESRLHGCVGVIQSGNTYLPDPIDAPWVMDYIEEFAEFPNSANDDQVDATTQMLLEWTQNKKKPVRSATAARQKKRRQKREPKPGEARAPPRGPVAGPDERDLMGR